MAFKPAVAEQRFVLEHVVRIAELAETKRFAAASDDLIDAVLEGVGLFAVGEWAPLAVGACKRSGLCSQTERLSAQIG